MEEKTYVYVLPSATQRPTIFPAEQRIFRFAPGIAVGADAALSALRASEQLQWNS
jgi:hypothetical protein